MSAIAKMYASAVLAGTRTIESVPERWRAEVEAIIDLANEE